MQYRSQAKDSNKESGKKLLQETETQELQKTNQPKKTTRTNIESQNTKSKNKTKVQNTHTQKQEN